MKSSFLHQVLHNPKIFVVCFIIFFKNSIDLHGKKIEIVFSHVDFRVAHKSSLLDISDSLRGDRIKTNLAYLVKSNIPGKAGSKSWEGLTQTFSPTALAYFQEASLVSSSL